MIAAAVQKSRDEPKTAVMAGLAQRLTCLQGHFTDPAAYTALTAYLAGTSWPHFYLEILPEGVFSFVCSWPASGVHETRHVIEHTHLITASARLTALWPRKPINHGAPPRPPKPRLPSTG